MEKKMDNEMQTGVIKGLYRDPSTQIVLTLGPAPKPVHSTYIGLGRSLGHPFINPKTYNGLCRFLGQKPERYISPKP